MQDTIDQNQLCSLLCRRSNRKGRVAQQHAERGLGSVSAAGEVQGRRLVLEALLGHFAGGLLDGALSGSGGAEGAGRIADLRGGPQADQEHRQAIRLLASAGLDRHGRHCLRPVEEASDFQSVSVSDAMLFIMSLCINRKRSLDTLGHTQVVRTM